MTKTIGTAFRQIKNKLGSRHRKAWAKGIKAKHGKYRKIGKLSHGKR